MDWNRIEGNWKQAQGALLTDRRGQAAHEIHGRMDVTGARRQSEDKS
jgi:uncharacterized protein YjbJ (UPF0337 family)